MTGPITVAMLNRKGGCGKTSTCHHLAGTFAKDGRRVLLVNMDPQASLTQGLFGPQATEAMPDRSTIAGLFDDAFDPDPDELIRTTAFEGISIVARLERPRRLQRPPAPGNRRDPAHPPAVPQGRPGSLRRRPDRLPAEPQPLQLGGVLAADSVVVPVQAEDYGAQGIVYIQRAFDLALAHHNPRLRLAGYLVTMFNKSLGIHAAYDHQLRALYGDQVFTATVPLAKDFKEAVAARQPVASYKPRSAASKSVKAVADELLERSEAARPRPAEFLYLGHRVGPKDLAIEVEADVDLEVEAGRGGGSMSKAAESLQRRFGQNLSESLGVRAGSLGAGGGMGIGPSPGVAFPGKPAPTTAGPGPVMPGIWRSTGSSRTPTSPARNSATTPSMRLAASLLKHGQLMPIRVRWNGPIGRWVVISGERRYRAAIRAGLKTVACVFADNGLSPSEILQEQIIENLLREDLKPIEQARAYRQLMDLHGWTAKELSGELQVSQGAISKSLMLLTLPVELQEQVNEGSIPATAAYEVAKVEDKEVQREIARRIVDEDLTRDAAADVVREAAGKTVRNPKAKGRGGASGRGSSRVFKAAGAKVAVTFPRKTVRDEDILAALEDAAEQVRAGLRAKDPAWAWRADFPGKSIA